MTKEISLKYLLILGISFISLMLLSCSKNTYPLTTGNAAIVKTSNKAEKFNFKIKFGNKQLDGILIARKITPDEVRILATTPFGLSLFDFGLKKDSFEVYSCIDPIRNERTLNILEKDFKLLFLPDRSVNKIEQKDSYTKYVAGKGFTKSVMNVDKSTPLSITIRHSWIRLSIHLNKIEEGSTDE